MPKTIVAIGEVLWDVFPDGRQPGGAPSNVAYHAARLGDRGVIVTRVGDDPLGEELVGFLAERGVETNYVQRDGRRPTGTVSVTMVGSEARYEIATDVAWDYLVANDGARALMRTADAVCVGSLAQRGDRGRAAIHELLGEARGHALIVFDVNLRPPFVDREVVRETLRVADLVKLNAFEVAHLASLLERPSLIDWLLGDVGVHTVCVTSGNAGASISTVARTVSVPGIGLASTGDSVGAGDAFTAAMVHQLVRNATPRDALVMANRYAGLVASKRGAMPEISADEMARWRSG